MFSSISPFRCIIETYMHVQMNSVNTPLLCCFFSSCNFSFLCTRIFRMSSNHKLFKVYMSIAYCLHIVEGLEVAKYLIPIIN